MSGPGTATIRSTWDPVTQMRVDALESWDLDRGRLYLTDALWEECRFKLPEVTRTWYGVRFFGRRFVAVPFLHEHDMSMQTFVALNQPGWLLVHTVAEIHWLLKFGLAWVLHRVGGRFRPEDYGQRLTWRVLGRACRYSWGGRGW